MKKQEFLEKFIDACEIEEAIDESTVLNDLDEWDSLAAVTTLALFKKNLNLNIGAQDIKSCVTVGDLLTLGAAKYE